MAIVISGVNNNDKITASDGTIDLLSGVNYAGIITAPAFTTPGNITASGNLTAGHINVGSNIQLGNAGVATATTFVGNLTGNVNATSNLLLQIGGSEKFRVGSSGQLGIGGANYGTSGQVLTSGGSGSAATWSTIPTPDADKITEGNTEAEVVDTGSDGHFKVTTEGSERLRIDSSGRLLFGINSSISGIPIQIASGYIQQYVAGNNADPGYLDILKTRNTSPSGNTILQDGDRIGSIRFRGNTGSGYVNGAMIRAVVNGTPGSGNDLPTDLQFHTMPDGTGSTNERLRIGSAGQLGIAGANYGTAGQVLTSQGGSSAPTWTTVASGGASNISFNSGNGIDFSATADGTGSSSRSELLDDYETGEWTGSINSGSANINNPWYVKIGKLVIGGASITAISDTSSSNSIIVNGLPFSNSGGNSGRGAVSASKNNKFDRMVDCYVSGTTVRFMVSSLSTGSWDYLRHSSVVQSSGSITFAFNYQTS